MDWIRQRTIEGRRPDCRTFASGDSARMLVEVWSSGRERDRAPSLDLDLLRVRFYEYCNATATMRDTLCLPKLELHEDATNVMYLIVEYRLECD